MPATININGKDMPEPAHDGIEISKEKIWSSNTGRTTDGTMTGDLIGTVTKIKVKWNVLIPSEVSLIDSAISDAFFDVTYPDPSTNSYRTIRMYAGTPTYPIYDIRDGAARYVGIAVDLIGKNAE
ncbi:MAG: hypothetical protein K2I03_08395 [Lachnospiraceae bacterium]|nr:hypothetical protein [Lachnospiraceae bacterium]